jgi:hypothetical protein
MEANISTKENKVTAGSLGMEDYFGSLFRLSGLNASQVYLKQRNV